MEHGKKGMGKMGMRESPQMNGCMQMMGEMETTNAALDELVGRMQAAEGAEKVAAMEEALTAMVAQQREMHKRIQSMPQMMCGIRNGRSTEDLSWDSVDLACGR